MEIEVAFLMSLDKKNATLISRDGIA